MISVLILADLHETYYFSINTMNNMILGIIPARGESKGLKRKNIQDLSGKPHIEWSIEAAIVFICSDAYLYMTGSNLVIDDGRTCL